MVESGPICKGGKRVTSGKQMRHGREQNKEERSEAE